MTSIAQIANGESGSSVRTKLNAVLDAVNVSGRTATAAFSLASTDDLDVVYVNSASTVTCTLPNSLAAGFTCTVVQLGAGVVTFSAEAGGSRNSRGALYSTAGQYAMASVLVRANTGTDAAWIIGGDLA